LSPPELAVGVPVDRGPDRPVDFPAPQGLPGPKPAGASNSKPAHELPRTTNDRYASLSGGTGNGRGCGR
jgi:hypothetical protein